MAVPFLAHAVLDVEVDAFEIPLEDEIDDARHRIGAVDRCCAARDDLDSVDRR
ncbi:hypothetical protein D3C83_53870 [compost metagenome]